MEDRFCRICKFPSKLFYRDELTFYKNPNRAVIFTNDFQQKTAIKKLLYQPIANH
jgi:hypothetical protein